eukprot:CAMPEP_0168534258 /NCGR_PEP_ID=MMETSP0405-20121227/17756_1 /TAXON_ID=498012 /ORGANISM="Trichosphaerium sp, Strain Am-I-7 wt" /LENGTH=153 /DNA_ID=CAMNT_0008560857 /DNA_START=218 /DNA_END=679 /DNA_ORIENTATION=+
MFSVLAPKSHIKPHVGYYQYSEKILRAHLGVVVPDGCALKVNQEIQGWEEGKCMVFDDTFTHEAWNKSDKTRAVLMVDFMYDRTNGQLLPKSLLTEDDDIALVSKDLLDTLRQKYGKESNFKERPNTLGYSLKKGTNSDDSDDSDSDDSSASE